MEIPPLLFLVGSHGSDYRVDLRMEAVRINAKHGVPLTKEERNRQIGELYEEGLTQSKIGELFGLSQRREANY